MHPVSISIRSKVVRVATGTTTGGRLRALLAATIVLGGLVSVPARPASAQTGAMAGVLYAKDGIHAGWIPLAEGGQVHDIAVSGQDWFGFVGSGNFYAKQGVYSGWLTMAGGGQATTVAVAS